MDEQLVRVDEYDVVRGSLPKEEFVGSDNIHRAVHVVLIDHNHILIQKRAGTKKRYPGLYEFSFSGSVKGGECCDETVRREGNEELSLDTDAQFFGKFLYQDEVNKEWAYLYTAIYDGQPLHMLQEEVEALRWIQVDELRRYLSHHPDRFTPVAVKGISLILEHHFPV